MVGISLLRAYIYAAPAGVSGREVGLGSDSNLQEARNSMVLRYKRIAGVVDASGDAPKRIEMYWNMRDEAQIARAHAR